jgi:branched-chain amino acid transport system permease protein
MLPQLLLNGLISGAIYALFALGFTMIFGVQKVLNLAHAGVFMAGAFFAYFLVGAGVPLWAAAICAMLGAGLLSVLVDILAFSRLRASGEAEFAAIVSSIGADLILISIGQIVSNTRVLRFPYDAFPVIFYDLLGLRISLLQIVVLVLTACLLAALVVYLYGTSYGRQVRAVAEDERASRLLGVNPRAIYFQTFFISGALAGIAAVLVGLLFNSIHFLMGAPYMLYAFVIVVLGGLGSIHGAVIAGLLIGLVKTLTSAYLEPALADIVIYSLLFVTLLLAPGGLFGRATTAATGGRQ